MRKIALFVTCFATQLIFAQNLISKTVSVDAAGWKRVARLDGAYGRGYNELVLMTRGGASAPRVAKISWLKGWSAYGGLNLISVSDGGFWSAARITSDGVKAHLEINFTTSIPVLNVFLDQSAWVGGDILDGALPNGGDPVLEWAKFGRVNYGENDFFLDYGGHVGIGTANPDAELTVKGKIHTQEVKVDLNGAVAPDYVFKEDYDLKTLEEVQEYINKNGHLPNIPSAEEMEENGLLLKDMNLKLLEKIEELTLYILQQQQQIQAMDTELKKLKREHHEQ